jgi:hypothetical protein
MPTTVTRTVAPSGGDETTLNAAVSWFESNYPNFVTSDIVGEIVIQGDWTSATDTTAVGISSITTDATRYLSIYTTGDARHNGIYGNKATAYKHEITNDVGILVDEIKYIRIDGLQMKSISTVSVGTDYCIQATYNTSGAADARISNNICIGVYSGSQSWGGAVFVYSANNTGSKGINIWNNIFYDFINGANANHVIRSHGTASSGSVLNAYNNTFQNSETGLYRTFGTVNSYNNGFSSVTTTYSGTVGGKTGDNTTTPSFVNEGGDDFHLQSGDTTWKDQTSDQSSGLFTDDIDGETRTGSWDVGADEYVASTGYTMLGRYLLEARSDGTIG